MVEKLRIRLSRIFAGLLVVLICVSGSLWEDKEPEEYILKPMVFKRHIFSGLWFVWLMGILEFIEGLHELRAFPTIFKIY